MGIGGGEDRFLGGWLSLMFFAEEVVNGFDGVESGERNFDEEGVPIGHCSIPETRKFLGFHYLSSFGFLADETGGWIDIFA